LQGGANLINLTDISTAQLKELQKILSVGVVAQAELDTLDAEAVVSDDSYKTINNEVFSMEDKEKIESLEHENATLKGERDSLTNEKVELEEKASQVVSLTDELNSQKEELELLRQFKKEAEEVAERQRKIDDISSKLEEAGIEFDAESDSDYWLSMTEDIMDKTINKFKSLSKKTEASVKINVPPIRSSDDVNDSSAVSVVSDGLKEIKQSKI